MSVYVGIDVHRKRSQIVIVDDAGDQQRNRNLPNDPAELLPILGDLPAGTPVASRPPTVGAGWSTCWTSSTWSRTWSTPAAPMAIASARLKERQGGRAHAGAAAARRPAARGLDRAAARP
jgi:hypothetical protein